jgi:putative beta-lysine N-acetyltransferase
MYEDFDTSMTLDGAIVQHGFGNNRIYLMDIGNSDIETLVVKLLQLAEDNGYTKIFAKVPESKADKFLDAGFLIEATAGRLFHGEEKGLFLGKFLDESRREEQLRGQYEDVLSIARAKRVRKPIFSSAKTSIRLCTPSDAPAMAILYKQVFASYPFPIEDPNFIIESMAEETIYAGIVKHGKFIALASAECSFKSDHLYAEMTDFATEKESRSNGYAISLLSFLEREVKAKGIRTAYPIARAASIGMNVTFAKSGYTFGGRLHNNTDIAGKIESMNVWSKPL